MGERVRRLESGNQKRFAPHPLAGSEAKFAAAAISEAGAPCCSLQGFASPCRAMHLKVVTPQTFCTSYHPAQENDMRPDPRASHPALQSPHHLPKNDMRDYMRGHPRTQHPRPPCHRHLHRPISKPPLAAPPDQGRQMPKTAKSRDPFWRSYFPNVSASQSERTTPGGSELFYAARPRMG
jgi:hypothetical protein